MYDNVIKDTLNGMLMDVVIAAKKGRKLKERG
jgi:hypothetical protein